jgi:hypothetical protein
MGDAGVVCIIPKVFYLTNDACCGSMVGLPVGKSERFKFRPLPSVEGKQRSCCCSEVWYTGNSGTLENGIMFSLGGMVSGRGKPFWKPKHKFCDLSIRQV